MLIADISLFENCVDSDQLASESQLISIYTVFNLASASTAKAGYDIVGSKSRSTAYILSTAMAKNQRRMILPEAYSFGYMPQLLLSAGRN